MLTISGCSWKSYEFLKNRDLNKFPVLILIISKIIQMIEVTTCSALQVLFEQFFFRRTYSSADKTHNQIFTLNFIFGLNFLACMSCALILRYMFCRTLRLF